MAQHGGTEQGTGGCLQHRTFAERTWVPLVHSAPQHFPGSSGFRARATRVLSMTTVHSIRRLRRSVPGQRRNAQAPSYVAASAVAIAALAAIAVVNRHLAKKAEHDNPPAGSFLELNGVRLHYVERGSGEPLVLLHGNGSMIQDFESSGLIDLAAKNYRVIVFDRPGFGHSDRPRKSFGRRTPRPN